MHDISACLNEKWQLGLNFFKRNIAHRQMNVSTDLKTRTLTCKEMQIEITILFHKMRSLTNWLIRDLLRVARCQSYKT